MKVRILADREPYASFAESAAREGGEARLGPHPGSFEILSGPPSLDEAPAEVLVLPASDFLALPRSAAARADYIAYGRVSLMDRAFEWGCIDYIREPWSLPELYARLKRLVSLKFRVGDSRFRLVGSALEGDTGSAVLPPGELALLRLLLRNAPLLVTKEAALKALSIHARDENHALGRCAVSLRHCLETLEPGLGRRLHAVRGLGYRFDAELCG